MRQPLIASRAVAARASLAQTSAVRIQGRVCGVSGLVIDVDGLSGQASVGDYLELQTREGSVVTAEVVGFRSGLAQAMPFGDLQGVGPGHPVRLIGRQGGVLRVDESWLGRVIDPLGRPVDGKGALIP